MKTGMKIASLLVLIAFQACEPEPEEQPLPITKPEVSTFAVYSITYKTAASGGEVTNDGGAQITSRGICWSTNNNPTINDYKTSNGAGTGNFTSELVNLSPENKYYVRAYATNSKGTAYGSELSFITLNTFADVRDGHEYKLKKIGDQIWMAENLAYLPWINLPGTISGSSPLLFVYGFDGTNTNDAKSTANYRNYGVLYNWPAAMNGEGPSNTNPSGVQGVCPTDWHIPSSAEWSELFNFLGNDSTSGGLMKESGTDHWAYPNEGATNQSGFTALPGGLRYYMGEFDAMGLKSYWWSSNGREGSGADVVGNY